MIRKTVSLQEIMDSANNPKRSYKRWSRDEDALLDRELSLKTLSIKDISILHERTIGSIRARRNKHIINMYKTAPVSEIYEKYGHKYFTREKIINILKKNGVYKTPKRNIQSKLEEIINEINNYKFKNNRIVLSKKILQKMVSDVGIIINKIDEFEDDLDTIKLLLNKK